jgi:hypothetical protein
MVFALERLASAVKMLEQSNAPQHAHQEPHHLRRIGSRSGKCRILMSDSLIKTWLFLSHGSTARRFTSVGHETKSFERCKAILMSRVFGAFRVSSEYFANVSNAARVGLDGQHCKICFLRPLPDVPT